MNKLRTLEIHGREFPILAAAAQDLLARHLLVECEEEGHDLHIDHDAKWWTGEPIGALLAAVADGVMFKTGSDMVAIAEAQPSPPAEARMFIGGKEMKVTWLGEDLGVAHLVEEPNGAGGFGALAEPKPDPKFPPPMLPVKTMEEFEARLQTIGYMEAKARDKALDALVTAAMKGGLDNRAVRRRTISFMVACMVRAGMTHGG